MAGEITVTETVVSVNATTSPVAVTVTPTPVAVTTTNQGIQGATGATGVVAATSPITYNSGTQTVGIDQTAIAISGTQITSGTIDSARIPTLNQNTTGTSSNVTGTVAVANGGTGKTTLTSGQVVVGNGTGAVTAIPVTTNGSTASALVQLDALSNLSVASGTLGRISAGIGGITTTGDISTGAGKAVKVIATGGGTSVITAQGAVNLSLPAGSGTLALTSGNITGTAANVTGTVAVANGGTGAITAPAALTNLGAVATTLVGAVNGVASLDGSGLIPTTQLPPLAISDTFVVASQAAMLALTAQVGDVAVRTDINQTFILQTTPPTTLANWIQILTPPAITSITASSPLTGGTITSTGTIGINDASTTVKGAVQLSDSVNTTDSTVAATSTAVKTANDNAATAQTTANGKVSSVSGTLPISVTTGTTPTVSIASATTAVSGAVQLTDSTSSTSTTTAATPNSVKTAYDLANGKVTSVSGTAPIAVTTGTTPTVSIASASTTVVGAVQLTDSTSSTSTTTAATPNSVKTVADSDALKAPLASPALTGTPTAPTATVDTNTTQIASTAFVLGQASTTTPLVDGTATIGTATTFARANHIHPTDTTRAAVAGQTFTGAITAPNVTDTALSTAGIVTNTSAGLLGTVASVPVANGGTGHGYGSPLVGKAMLYQNYTKASNDTTPEAIFRNASGTIQYFNVDADTSYLIEGVISMSQIAATSAALRMSLIYYNTGALTTLTEQTCAIRYSTNFSISTYNSFANGSAANTNVDLSFTSSSSFNHHVLFRAFIRTNATTAGRINVGATQTVTGATAPIFTSGSHISIYKMGTGLVQTLGNWS